MFWDINRNGEYDVDDRVLENNAVVAERPGGSKAVKFTNFNGFANFPMSIHKSGAVISGPGDYDFTVLVPPGWAATTENVTQRIRFRALPGAFADIAGYPPFKSVSLNPSTD